MSKLIRIKALHAFGLAGKHVAAGSLVEVTPIVGHDLIARGRAVPVRADAPAKQPASPTKKPSEAPEPDTTPPADDEAADDSEDSDPEAGAPDSPEDAKKGKGGKKSAK